MINKYISVLLLFISCVAFISCSNDHEAKKVTSCQETVTTYYDVVGTGVVENTVAGQENNQNYIIDYPKKYKDKIAMLGEGVAYIKDGKVEIIWFDDKHNRMDYSKIKEIDNVQYLYSDNDRGLLAITEDGSISICTPYEDYEYDIAFSDIETTKKYKKILFDGTYIILLEDNGKVYAENFSTIGSLYGAEEMDKNIGELNGVVDIVGSRGSFIAILADGEYEYIWNQRLVENPIDISEWAKNDIVDIARGLFLYVCVTGNGKVLLYDEESSWTKTYVEEVINWDDVVQISASTTMIAALKSDGTILITIDSWKNINQSAVAQVSEWNNLVYVNVGETYLVGITEQDEILYAEMIIGK